MRGNGERIGPQNLPTSSIAGGIWNLLNQQRAQQRGAWPSAAPAVTTDPYFMYVPLLLNTTSTNGQQNNTFLDSSSNAFTITRNGTPTQGSFTPYRPSGYWSNYFTAASSQYLTGTITAPSSSIVVLECWVYNSSIDNTNGNHYLQVGVNNLFLSHDGSGVARWTQRNDAGSTVYFNITSASGVVKTNQWQYWVGIRSGSNAALYIDGTRVGSATGIAAATTTQTALYIGTNAASGSPRYADGYISNARIVSGTLPSGYDPTQTTIAVPTTPLTAVTGTSLLTCQSNRFVDNSLSPITITPTNSPKVQAFQPFAPAASYSAATYGGSGYFNGSTDYLSLTASTVLQFGSNPYTIEGWIYQTSRSGSPFICGGVFSGTGMQIGIDASGFIYVSIPGVANLTAATIAIPLNTWTHFACVRSSTSAGGFTYYINGVAAGTPTDANNYSGTSTTFNVATTNNSSLYVITGYLSNFRIVKGTAIVPPAGGPTLPLTAVSGTSLLTNFTNAGIYDAAWQNNALTVGDAQSSTTQYKWSPTSMKFDGTGDILSMPTNQGFAFGTGNFTIEFWFYQVSRLGGGYDAPFISTGSIYVTIGSGVNGYFLVVLGAFNIALTGSLPSLNAWHYMAIVRNGAIWNVYLDGISVGTGTFSGSVTNPTGAFQVGWAGTSDSYFNGYIQDLRITKGVARTITTPTAAFPTR